MLIQMYPGLIFSGLSFTQLMKHNRIFKNLATVIKFAERLINRVTFSVQDLNIILLNKHKIPAPKLPLTTDPDYIYEVEDREKCIRQNRFAKVPVLFYLTWKKN